MKAWHEEGIPLPVVLEAIESCFLKGAEGRRNRVVSSLSYCRHAVKEIWSDRRDMYVGAAAEVPESDLAATLQRIAADLRTLAGAEADVVSEPLQRAANAIEAIGASSVPAAEEKLAAIEEQLFADLRAGMEEKEKSQVEAELARRLDGSREMSQEIADRTREANLRGILRTRYHLPRLSLFA